MRLPRPVIGILTQDDHLDLLERSRIERVEDHRPRWIDRLASGLLAPEKGTELDHVGLVELLAQRILPACLEPDAIVLSHGRFPVGQAAEP